MYNIIKYYYIGIMAMLYENFLKKQEYQCELSYNIFEHSRIESLL